MIKNILYVGIGGFLGSTSRYLISKYLNANFPHGTLFVNVLGCLMLGFFSYKLMRHETFPPELILMITTGFIGAFTTFSTYMIETHVLLDQQQFVLGFVNLFGNLLLGFIFAYVGIYLGRIL